MVERKQVELHIAIDVMKFITTGNSLSTEHRLGRPHELEKTTTLNIIFHYRLCIPANHLCSRHSYLVEIIRSETERDQFNYTKLNRDPLMMRGQ